MVAFFTAVVGAPFTGSALITEMTSTTAALVPMLAACFGAVPTTTLLGSEPIYDAPARPAGRFHRALTPSRARPASHSAGEVGWRRES